MGPPGGMGGQGIVAATAIHRSLKPVRKKGRPSQAHDANDADEDDSKIIHHSCTMYMDDTLIIFFGLVIYFMALIFLEMQSG